MDITLIVPVSGGDVHGSENSKRTGCGINLLKPENVTRYIRKGSMTDLKEITCEKCKTVLAKKMIKADKKEMSRLLKEEKIRNKRGLDDAGIVPLGNTTAKITKSPEQRMAEERAEQRRRADAERAERERRAAEKKAAFEAEVAREQAAEEARLRKEEEEKTRREAAQAASAPAPAVSSTIPGTGVAMDSSLAQFAINVAPTNQFEESEPTPEPEPAPAPQAAPAQDDFLAQFAINKPEPTPVQQTVPEPAPEPIAAPAQDDFLAQFAVSEPADDMNDVFKDPEPPKDIFASPASASQSAPMGDMNDIFTDPEPTKDIFASSASTPQSAPMGDMNDVFTAPEPTPVQQTAPEPAPVQQIAPEPAPVQQTAPEPAPVQQTAPEPAPVQQTAPEPAPVQQTAPEPAYEEPEEVKLVADNPVIADSIEDAIADFDNLANNIFGGAARQPAPVKQPEPVKMPEPVKLAEPTPVFEQPSAPEANNIADNTITDNTINNNTTYTAPVFSDEQTVQPMQPNFAMPFMQPGMGGPVMQTPDQPMIMSVPQFSGYDQNGQPVYSYIQSQFMGYDQNGQPLFMPIQPPMGAPMQQAPFQQAPIQQPVMPMPEQMTAPIPMQQTAPAPVPVAEPMPEPVPTQAAPAPMPEPVPMQAAPAPMPEPVPMQAAPTPMPAAPVPMQAAPNMAPPAQQSGYRTPQVNISKVGVPAHKVMPTSFAKAMSVSRANSQKNIFDMHGKGSEMPVIETIEAAISNINDGSGQKKNQKTADTQQSSKSATPVFEEYKSPSRPITRVAAKKEEEYRPMTKSELKAMKKQEKIDQKFQKNLAKRGF